MVIFVTGKSGSGKSVFSKFLAQQLKYKYLDVDKVVHKIYESPQLMVELEKLFGRSIYDNNGVFDRKKLGELLFSETNKSIIEKVNNITWHYMKPLIDSQISDNVIVDWALLPISEYWDKKAIRILIKVEDEEKRIQYIMKRDNVSKEYAQLRNNSGIEYNTNDYDFVITNDYNISLEDSAKKIKEYIISM